MIIYQSTLNRPRLYNIYKIAKQNIFYKKYINYEQVKLLIKKLNENIEDVQVNIRKLAVPINGIFDSVEIQIKD